ncbi:hypothetical protein FOYG_02108 [Fusarium oxysporum NRRL 32931]|uniref:Uncharacterized protein n=1 Tax=Fusarium oxysporum NRRL 32931 TaxID=660029 RepID=W9J6R6_FUSOX|nr:hypothetical protein FOYG_02108 [Fusarium oxysporum NRRL 32931]
MTFYATKPPKKVQTSKQESTTANLQKAPSKMTFFKLNSQLRKNVALRFLNRSNSIELP